MIPLPIDDVLPQAIQALRSHVNLVLKAPTGAGKTTRVPGALLNAGLAERGTIVMLEPRRLAARADARRMAHERNLRLGDLVGYQVRFDRVAGPNTRILVVTPGILLQRLHHEPFLESVQIIVLDEFHERQLEGDLVLGIARLLQQTVRPDLKLVVMSATLEAQGLSEYLGKCPVVESQGRTFPVTIEYENRAAGQMPLAELVAGGVKKVLAQTTGDVLVFLPGMYEIRAAERELQGLGCDVLPLHGDLPAEQQDAALLPGPRRKIVLATNVAETSVTVEGVTAVVDSGLARIMEFDPHIGMDRLEVKAISKASADQRAGRAGRTQPGVCLRLWNEIDQRGRIEQTEPEIRRVDLAGPILHLLCLGEDVRTFPWLEAPKPAAVEQALELLQRLDAIGEPGRVSVWSAEVTDVGRDIARMPVSPRLGRMLLEGQRLGDVRRVALAAALLSERDPFQRSNRPQTLTKHRTHSDVLDRLEAIEEFERTGRFETPLGTLNRNATRFLLRSRDQIVRSLRDTPLSHMPPEEIVRRALFAGFPDRLARRRNPGARKGVMVGGRGVRLSNGSGVTEGELFVCVDVDAGGIEAEVRLASAVEREWLPADRLVTTNDVYFDEKSQRVQARKRLRFDDLLLEETAGHLPQASVIAAVLAEAVQTRLGQVLPADDSATGQYLLRVRWLREWLPELQLPAFDDADLGELARLMCAGCKSFAELKNVDWLGAVQGRLTYEQRQALEREAPEKYAVPSGHQHALKYEMGRPPVLAVRIQEMFGVRETPRVAGGRVRVLLHLLAPNYRPQQVTEDLASFWANTYPQVRKDLRARYPKHAWPEIP